MNGKTSTPKAIIIAVIILAVIAVTIRFGVGFFSEKQITDESRWETMDEPRFSITVPKSMNEGKMLSMSLGEVEVLKFCTSTYAGFDVSVHKYTEEEKSTLGLLDAEGYAAAANLQKPNVGGIEYDFEVREGKNYLYVEYPVTHANYVSSSEKIWFVEALFPMQDGYYSVNVYCARDKKDKMRDYLFKWLDSFTPKEQV